MDTNDIRWMDHPFELLHACPEMFFPCGFNPISMAKKLLGDALLLGAREVLVHCHADWFVISADIDWLSVGEYRPDEIQQLFFEIVHFSEAGENSMRSEVLLTAYASTVVSKSHHDQFVIKGDIQDNNEIWSVLMGDGMARSIAFRLDP